MAPLCHVICFFLALGLAAASTEMEHSIHYSPNYPYALNAENHKFEGRICSDMELYALIPIEPDNLEEELEGGACVTYLEQYLKLIVRRVSWHHHKKTAMPTTSTTLHPPHRQTTLHPYISDPIDLPPGVDFDIINTDLVDVDDAYYLIVSEPDTLRRIPEVQFYVVLINLTDYSILSNPLPFAVRVDHPPDEGRPHGAAVFAGVLVLAIILIALLIPVTVCVKRRRKAGKPVCQCVGGKTDEEKSEMKGRVNNGFIDTRDARSDSNGSSVSRHHETIGSHQLGSVSSMHFQPTWLDPHFKEMDTRAAIAMDNRLTPLDSRQIQMHTRQTPMDTRNIKMGHRQTKIDHGPEITVTTEQGVTHHGADSRL